MSRGCPKEEVYLHDKYYRVHFQWGLFCYSDVQDLCLYRYTSVYVVVPRRPLSCTVRNGPSYGVFCRTSETFLYRKVFVNSHYRYVTLRQVCLFLLRENLISIHGEKGR